MAEVKWVKISTDIFENPKIVIISEMKDGSAMVLAWIKLITLAGRLNNSGKFSLKNDKNFDEKTIAKMIKISPKKFQNYLKVFEEFEMIFREKNTVSISNWDKYQSEDKLEKIRQQTRKRVQSHREKQTENGDKKKRYNSVTERYGNATDIDIDKEIEKDIEIYKEKHPKGCKEKSDSVPKSDASKHRHGEYGHVLLSDGEFEKLKAEYPNADELIAFLDEYIEMKGYKARNHYLCIKKWVTSAVGERKKKSEGKGNGISDKHKEWAELERFMEGENGKSDEDI